MIWFIKQLFRELLCVNHKWEHKENLYGAGIEVFGGNRSLWICTKCGAIQARPELHKTNND